MRTSAGATQSPSAPAIGLVHDHALREQALERLVDASRCPVALHGAGEEARIEQVQDRVLDAADILVDRQPASRPTAGASSAPSVVHGAVKRAKYQDESTKVSIVSVSRRAGPAALRAGDMLPGRMVVERVAGLVEADIVGQHHRQVGFRHRHDAAVVAMDHRDRAAPVALARDAPVAQAELHLALGQRPVAAERSLSTPGDLVEGLGGRHAVEEARIDHHAVVDIGLVDDLEASPGRRRAGITTGITGRPYLLAKSRSRWSCATGSRRSRPVP